MTRFVSRRLGLALITLFLLSLFVFVVTHQLPGDVGRLLLGPYATQESVDLKNQELGLDRPLLTQYWSWVTGFVQGDLGESYQYQVPVSSLLGPALVNSFKLALVSIVIIVPISILGGAMAALKRDRIVDRMISVAGISMTAIPEFVTGVVLITIFGVWLHALPATATAPPGTSPLGQLEYLILPAVSLALVYFGYLSRMARAGIIEAVDADYTRTAHLKGVRPTTVIRRHVLRNALLPTIAVIATQVGFILGGLLVIETLFNYHGLGERLYTAAKYKDFAVIQSGAMLTGIIFVGVTLLGDVLIAALDPRIRLALQRGRVSS